MKIAVIGANGMLGQDLMKVCERRGVEGTGFDLPDVNIVTGDSLETIAPCDVVVNCAAYTDVNGAESDRDKAFAVNGAGVGRLASWCLERDVLLVQISSDYVFNGTKKTPYLETDPVAPVNAYGESKLAGENEVLQSGVRHLIVRTQSLFGKGGKNFVDAIAAQATAGGQSLQVVNDQTSCPTYTVHLAESILDLLDCGEQGIVHASAAGQCTWYEFAVVIAQRVNSQAHVEPVSSEGRAAVAARPAFSVLDCERLRSWIGRDMPSWEDGLDQYFQEDSGGAA